MTAIDQSIRQRAATELGTSIALEAGAGSGKTSVLVDRIVHLLRAGTSPKRVAAITFTEKAAGELQERVRDRLEDALRDAPDDPALQAALGELPDLTLSTIHAFCRQLLLAEALDGGWAPDTDILADLFAAPGVDAAWRRWRRTFDAAHPFAARILRTRVKTSTLRSGIASLVEFRDLVPVADDTPFTPEALAADARAMAQQVVDAAAGCTNPACLLLTRNADVLSIASGVAMADDVTAVTTMLLPRPDGNLTGGRAGDWPGGGKKTFVDTLKAWRAWDAEPLTRLHGLVMREARAGFVDLVAEAKAEDAQADYSDLLFRAVDLLTLDDARRRLSARFDAVLVDEVQDTDPIQARAAALLTRSVTASGPWSAVPPEPGRLFAVGDPKQSIYRFRRADVRTWSELDSLISSDGASLRLAQNFRSVPGIVRWVNAVFAGLPGYEAQEPYRGPGALDPVVVVRAEEEGDEIDALVRYLADLHARGAEVPDRSTGALRPLEWGDVMVLLPAWTRAEAVLQSLTDAGIPALVEGGTGFLSRPEIQLCIAAMRALDEPADGESTVLVLRGLFGCTHDTLLRHVNDGGSWRYTVPDPPPGPVADAFKVLGELHRARGRENQVPLLDELLRRTHAAEVWSLRRDGMARLANLAKLRTLIRQLEPECFSPAQVIEELRELAKEERDLSRSEVDAPAVRITSYFKAKGLEAPVVALVHAKRNVTKPSHAVDREHGRIAVRIPPMQPPDWDTLWEPAERQEAEEERARWMYVATTRARDQLVLVRSSASKLLDDHVFANHPALAVEHGGSIEVNETSVRVLDGSNLPAVGGARPTFPGLDPTVDAALAAPPPAPPADPGPAAWKEAVRTSKSACTRWRSVHELAMRERARGRSEVGPAGGSLIHEALDHLDLSLPREELRARGTDLLQRLRSPRLPAAVVATCGTLLAQILDHPVLDSARIAPRRVQELPFTYVDRGRHVSGTIDLCFPTDASQSTWVVVDWKSDLPPEGTAGRRNYERQLAVYAKALIATIAPCTHVETLLVGPYPELGGPGARDIALAEVAPALRSGLAGLLDRGVPVPLVGLDLEGGAIGELVWETEMAAVLVDAEPGDVAALRRAGWRVHAADAQELTWAEAAVAWIAQSFELDPDPTEGVTA